MEKPQVTELENGFKIVTQKMPSTQVYANVAMAVGARHESAAEAGISHYLEHMLASDTTRMTSEESDVAVQNMRGMSNATTNYEKTDYFYHLNKDHAEDAIELLSDSILRSTLDPARIEVEREAVIEELRGRQYDPGSITYEQLLQVAFPGTGLDKSIGGDIPTVEGHTREDLVAFMDKHYSADKMVLTVVGDVEHDQIVEMAKKHFDGLPVIPKDQQIDAKPAEYRGGMRLHDSEEVGQVTLMMGFEGSGTRDAKTAATDEVLADMLGGGFSSRLMRVLRSEKGLVYYAGAGSMSFDDNGVFTIQAGTNGDKVEDAVYTICDELKKAVTTLTEEEMSPVKNSLLGQYERGMENVGKVGQSLVASMTVNGKAMSLEEEIKALDSVTLEDVKARAAEIFASAPCISAHGKGVDKIPSYEAITERLGHPRSLDASGLAVENVPNPDREAANSDIAGKPPLEQQRGVA